MIRHRISQRHWVFCIAALAVWLAMGWPFLRDLATGASRQPVPALWLVPFALFGAAVVGASLLTLRPVLRWGLLCVQLAAVLAMTVIRPSDLMTIFLVIIAWQVAMATTARRALGWIGLQTLAISGALLQAPNPDLALVVLSFVLQLCFVFTAHALRRQAEAARALARTNRELIAAQALIATTARDAERLRLSRELHDAGGHELTALGLQLEIASHVSGSGRAGDHVLQAKGLASSLLAKVRDAVAALRNAERSERPEGAAAGLAAHAAPAPGRGSMPFAARNLGDRRHWVFCVAALAVGVALAWPVLVTFLAGGTIRDAAVPAHWLVPFALFGAALLAAIVLKLRPGLHWILLSVQVAAVAAMAFIVSWAGMSLFLIIVAWQVAMTTGPAKALGWVAFQTLAVTAALAVAPNPDLCWVIGKSFALQLFFVFAAQALQREAATTRALTATNSELVAAQAILADTVRDAERLRISRELHDAWGHELTALGLQLEIASHVTEPGRASDHVIQAKGLARGLLGKVRDVVSTLREAECADLRGALEALAHRVPVPAIHVDIAPGLRVGPDQAHALIRCAQEAVTNAVRHSEAANLWLEVAPDREGVRLVARDDGSPRAAASAPGSGLVGMRERLEHLGGRLAVRAGAGFTVDAWLPSREPRTA